MRIVFIRSAIVSSLLCVSPFLTVAPAQANAPASGTFVARRACAAPQSIRTGANSSNVKIERGARYRIVAKNQARASHYLIRVAGAHPAQRWVAVDCGKRKKARTVGEARTGGAPQTDGQPSYVIAVSWQPAFCETRPDKQECRTQTPDRFDATHFALHGLWPQPGANIYCNVPKDQIQTDKANKWENLPAPKVSPVTHGALAQVMPGTMSFLERHEWIKHGVCFHGEPADTYFARSVALMSQLNGSKVRDLFASRIGAQITADEIKQAFDSSFGAGAGDRIRISCNRVGGRNLIGELTIGLSGKIEETSTLAQLIAASKPTVVGCPGGTVDAVNTR